MDRTEKRKFVAGLNAALADVSMVVVTQNQGLTVAEATDLRRRMRAAGATFKIAKNRLAHLALDGTQFDGLKPLLKGPTALAWSKDPVAVAKAAVEFAKTNDKLVLIGGALGTRTLDVAGDQGTGRAAEPGGAACRIAGDAEHPGDTARRRAAGPGRPVGAGLRGLCQTRRGGRHRAGGGLSFPRRERDRGAATDMPDRQAGKSGLQGTNQSLD